jgi:hypothetical protein
LERSKSCEAPHYEAFSNLNGTNTDKNKEGILKDCKAA